MDAGLAAALALKIRLGVKFHDGSPLTADDVVYSILRAQEQAIDIETLKTKLMS